VKRLAVVYRGWGEHWPLGTLAHSGGNLLFEYSQEALREGIVFSPLHHPLRTAPFANGPPWLDGLPGFVADALPDGWGMRLMDRMVLSSGRDPATLSPLERLAIIGDRAIGALAFEPATPLATPLGDTLIFDLADKVATVAGGRGAEVLLREMLVVGGSPHGARPKALAWIDPRSERISLNAPADAVASGAEPWLIKFPARGEHPEVCAIEEWYARLARNCGIEVPETRYFPIPPRGAAFAVRRFDREGTLRVPVQSLAGLLQTDIRIPAVDAIDFLRFTRLMTSDEREVAAAFGRCTFNVLANNRDDHAKNFSYRMTRSRRWRLAPAYDLTFDPGPGGHHQLSMAGETRAPRRADLLRAAARGGIEESSAVRIIDAQRAAAADAAALARDLPIRKATLKQICRHIAENLDALKA
jgi:serine/threonine-protein kinase HipA